MTDAQVEQARSQEVIGARYSWREVTAILAPFVCQTLLSFRAEVTL